MTPILPILLPGMLTPKLALRNAFEAGTLGFQARYVGGDLPLAPRMVVLADGLRHLSTFRASPHETAALTEIASDGLAHSGSASNLTIAVGNSLFSHADVGRLLSDTVIGWNLVVLPTLTTLMPPDRYATDHRSLALFSALPPPGHADLVGFAERRDALVAGDGNFQVLDVHPVPSKLSAHQRLAWRARLARDVAAVVDFHTDHMRAVLPPLVHAALGVSPALLDRD